ncbi:hypothetical protein KM427_23065 [Nocardioides sp. LMS-CY]|uniref:hypothetical protein n=1 Tax=Nocardioides sp. (strain LMS-CY) TaxID=2840457 RepID=UPI001C00729A|nr:hypothetical protein [Nocardioides sp. LMS-CY]QWF21771.1 hypothetical protein KM427_23065 [Nocardioides sp. LMS-CY]
MRQTQPPLLTAVLHAQDTDNDVVAFPQIENYARQISDWSRQFEQPVLMAVGDAAQRLLGAVSLIQRAHAETHVWTHGLRGRNVLLVGTVAASLIEFEVAAANARSRGASTVHACAIEVQGQPESHLLDSMTLLSRSTSVRRSA